MKTLYLNTSNWDLEIDSSGNIAVAEEPYSIAQDASSAIRCFKGDCYYNQDLGVPYLENILGKLPSRQYIKAQFVAAALTVPGAVSAKCFITGISNRNVHGQVQVTDENEIIVAANF